MGGINKYVMNYLITWDHLGLHHAMYAEVFHEKDFQENTNMIVYDLVNHTMLINNLGWTPISIIK